MQNNKIEAIEFMKWANGFVSSKRQKAVIQAPDYDGFWVYNRNGEPVYPKGIALSYEQLYNYWKAEKAINAAPVINLEAKVFTMNPLEVENLNSKMNLNELVIHNPLLMVQFPNGNTGYYQFPLSELYIRELPSEQIQFDKETSIVSTDYGFKYFLTKATTNIEFIDLTTLPDGCYTDANHLTQYANVYNVGYPQGYRWCGNCFLLHSTPVPKISLKYSPFDNQ